MRKVSVIIPVYNARDFIGDCLNSVAQQNFAPDELEIIVINDGSTDKSRQILDEFEQKYPNLRVIHQNNQGPAQARTAGLKNAHGEFIFILSHDCVADPNWVAEIVSVFEKQPQVGVVQSQIRAEKTIDQPIVHCTQVKQFSPSFETAGIAYRTRALDQAGRYFDPELSEFGDDTDLAWRILEAGFTSRWINQPLVFHKVIPQRFFKEVRKAWGIQKFNLLLKKHPGLAQHLRLGIFWGSWTRPLGLGLILLSFLLGFMQTSLAAVILTIGLTVFIYSGWKKSSDYQVKFWQKLFLIIPHHFLTNLVGEIALIWGSIKYRRLVL